MGQEKCEYSPDVMPLWLTGLKAPTNKLTLFSYQVCLLKMAKDTVDIYKYRVNDFAATSKKHRCGADCTVQRVRNILLEFHCYACQKPESSFTLPDCMYGV